jgi:hypothetical protein
LAEAVDFDALERVVEVGEVFEAASWRADELHAARCGADDGRGVTVELLLGE